MESRTLRTVKNTFQDIITEYQSLELRAMRLNSMLTQINLQQQIEIEQRTKISEQLATLLEMLPGGVIVLDNAGIVVQNNAAAISILEATDLVGLQWSTVLANNCMPTITDGLEIALQNGKLVSIASNILPAQQGQIILINDLTKTRELQATLNQQKKLSAMGEMLSSLAHQIKTPLASAILYIAHVCNQNIDHSRRQTYASRVKERLLHLDELLQSMLTYVKGATPATAVINVNQLLQTLSAQMQDSMQAQQMQLICVNLVAGKSFLGNQSAVVSALINLINNSVQASQPGAHICLIAKPYSATELELIVADKGVGIAATDLPKVRQAFFTTKSTGTGLGLSVVEIVAESCHGEVWIESTPGKGTKVGIRVPLKY